jgi:hypothetical protein
MYLVEQTPIWYVKPLTIGFAIARTDQADMYASI